MAQYNNILIMFNSTRSQYLQPRKEKDGADPWFENIDNWVLNLNTRVTIT